MRCPICDAECDIEELYFCPKCGWQEGDQREDTMYGLVKVTLTKAEAEWLYDVLSEKFDEGASTGRDELMSSEIATKVDVALGE